MSDQDEAAQPMAAPLSIADILQILFKWKVFIAVVSTLGLLVGVVVWFVSKPLYLSTASILVLYVAQAKATVAGMGTDEKILSPDARGANILGTELGILTSLDLCEEVANIVGIEKLVGKEMSAIGNRGAALVVKKLLSADSPRKSNLINVSFTHQDPEVARTTLAAVLDRYKEKHIQVHRNKGSGDEFLSSQADQWKTRLSLTEGEIRTKMESIGVSSIDEAKKAATSQLATIRNSIFLAEAEIAELEGMFLGRSEVANIVTTNTPSTSGSNQVQTTTATPIPQESMTEYKSLLARHQALLNQKMDLLSTYTEQHPSVLRNATMLGDVEKLKKELETKYPRIAIAVAASAEHAGAPSSHASGALPHVAFSSPEADRARIFALKGRIEALNRQATKIRAELTQVSSIEFEVSILQRRKALEEENYKNFSAAHERAKMDTSVGSERVSNINVVQSPSTPIPDAKAKIKRAGPPVGVGFAIAFGFPLLLELFLRPTVNSSRQVEAVLRKPVFFTIPLSEAIQPRQSKRPLLRFFRKKTEETKDVMVAEPTLAPWAETHPLRSYFEALRDRTVMALEHLKHKPKLIAVTGCAPGSGTTSIAAGLAATLSETGDGSVLLVDMNLKQGAAHPFFRGSPSNLVDLMEGQGQDASQINTNLYLASGADANAKISRVLPTRFNSLLPKLKASNYDYVIFDLPPVGPTSATPLISKMMDMVVLLVEAEQVPKGALKEGEHYFHNSQAKVVTVLNKSRNHLPGWLSGPG